MTVNMRTFADYNERQRGVELASLRVAKERAQFAYAQACVAHAVALIRELLPEAAFAEIRMVTLHDGPGAEIATIVAGDAGQRLYDADANADELRAIEDDLVPIEDYLIAALRNGYQFVKAGYHLIDLIEVR